MYHIHHIHTKTSICFLFVLICSIGNYNLISAQEVKPEQQLIVEFNSALVKIPAGLRTLSLSQPLSFLPPGLQSALVKHGGVSLSKAFPAFSPADALRTSRTGEHIQMPDLSHIYIIMLSSDVIPKSVSDSLQNLPYVLFAEPNGITITQAIYPNDPRFDNPSGSGSGGQQWNLLNTGQSFGTHDADIDAPEAWDITKGSSSTKIGIIDSGIRSSHEDLNGKVSGDTRTGDHGTHVAGIAAAKTNNSKGIAGIDWNAQIINKVNGDDPTTYNAIIGAVNIGADILNNSYVLCSNCINPIPTPRYSTLVRRAFATAYKMNVVSAASMGNYNNSSIYYPAGFGQGMIAVGATNRNDQRWSSSNSLGSNTGNHLDVVAPGVGIVSTTSLTTSSYNSYTGTSMAAPHIAGIAGLLLAKKPSLYNDDIEQLIKLSAEDVNAANKPGFDTEMGHGRVNAHKALLRLQSPYVLNHYTANGGTVVNVTQENKALYDVPGLANGPYIVRRNEVRKTVTFPYMSEVHVWGRGVATNGYSIANPNFGMGWNQPVTVSNNRATLRTYVYEVFTISGQRIGWFPASPSNVRFAYTVHGKRGTPPLNVSINGLNYINRGTRGTWSANASGGTSPYSFTWYRSYSGSSGPWTYVGSGNSYSQTASIDFWLRLVGTDSGSNSDRAVLKINVLSCSNPPCAEPRKNALETSEIPTDFRFHHNYPNPFNPTTNLSFDLPEQARVRLEVYNIMGRRVATVVQNNALSAGTHEFLFDASALSSGLYIARMRAIGTSGQVFTRNLKMQLIK
ncbi:MAG: S8 family serine peptidase [Bacteroidota bacterium]